MARAFDARSYEGLSSGSGRDRDSRINAALRLLEDKDTLRLEQAARIVNLSESRLRHLLRNALGISPRRYLKRRRLLLALELVGNTFLTIKQIGCAAGFTDQSHFLRDYKAAFGETPSETRRRIASLAIK